MVTLSELIDRYVAVWNEGDAEERRRAIRAVWAPGGSTCYRLLDARGYEAIEARVVGSWEKWIRDGKYRFRPKHSVAHHDAVKLEFELVTAPGGTVEAGGLCFLLLDQDGRIAQDYQFNPSANDAAALAERYVAAWSEPDPDRRRRLIAALWTKDGRHISETAVLTGHDAIADGAVPADTVLAFANRSQMHHAVASLTFERRPRGGGSAVATGTELLVFDPDGRIRVAYRYETPS
ncbi:MAG TPA: nuclear transport factor 2 family protein [Stellaceae bacterium]|nr:nuclear transport factor 2 family protein [Stellaceae bacterium]